VNINIEKIMFQQKNFKYAMRSLPEGQFEKAKELHQQGLLGQAQLIYESVLRMQPDHVDSLHFLGILHSQKMNYVQAISLIGKAIEIQSNNPAQYLNLGSAQQNINQFEAARASYEKALSIKSDYAPAYVSRASLFMTLHEYQSAIDDLDKAVRMDDNCIEAYYNLGYVHKELGNLEVAVENYDIAIELNPNFAEAYLGRGDAQLQLNNLQDGMFSIDKALAITPDYALANWAKSIAHLLSGDFSKGWILHEWRWKIGDSGNRIKRFSQPLWLGEESLQDKKILIFFDHGLGDGIQFSRYLKLVSELGAHVILEVPQSLFSLFQSLKGVDELVVAGRTLPYFDYYCPLLSLPLAFNTNIETIPSEMRYFDSDISKIEKWNKILGEKNRKRVGLVWSGNSQHKNDYNRSIRLADLLSHLSDDFEYVSLQQEVREHDLTALESTGKVRHFGPDIVDFSDTAALCELMDVVVSVDTSVAHLCGALGKPTWILIPYAPDWRWLLDRDDSPWYPTVSLYRQTRRGEWNDVIERIAANLTKFVTPQTMS
jgi:tetratricopeptide (TPR) repeat protein